jgi:hypothetical protein
MMMRFNRLLLLLLAVAASGCSTLYKRVDLGLSDQDVSFASDNPHFHEVLDELGPPSRLSAAGDGFVFLYEDMLIRELQTGIGGQQGWLQLLKLSFADSKLFRKTAILRFNSDGILISKAISETREELGKSGAIQPILSVQQLVDTARFEDDASEPQRWGYDLLRPIPQVLNTAQSLDSGQAGVEQSGTTSDMGQHTLEMR